MPASSSKRERRRSRSRRKQAVNFAQLDIETLSRYRRAFRVQGYKDGHTSKYDMLISVKKHFDNFQIEEVPIIEEFLGALDRSYEPVDPNERHIAQQVIGTYQQQA